MLPGSRAWKAADFITEGQIVDVKTSGRCRANGSVLFWVFGCFFFTQRSWETLKQELREKHSWLYLVPCNKTLVIVCDFKVELFGKMGSMHASTSRRCYACYIVRDIKLPFLWYLPYFLFILFCLSVICSSSCFCVQGQSAVLSGEKKKRLRSLFCCMWEMWGSVNLNPTREAGWDLRIWREVSTEKIELKDGYGVRLSLFQKNQQQQEKKKIKEDIKWS